MTVRPLCCRPPTLKPRDFKYEAGFAAAYRALFENVWGQQAFVIAWPSDVDQVCSRPGPPSASDPLPVHLSDVDRGRAGATFDQMAGSVLPIDPSYWFHTVATSAMVSAAEIEQHPWMPALAGSGVSTSRLMTTGSCPLLTTTASQISFGLPLIS